MSENVFFRNIQIGKYDVDIRIEALPNYIENNTYIWGFPYFGREQLINDEWVDDTLNSISGYYFALRISDEEIEIVNDILGGYRMYYSIIENHIYIRDNYIDLIEIIKGYHSVEIDETQLMYWEKHRFTLNKNTLIKDIYKFSPAERCLICGDGVHTYTYFENYKRTTNTRTFLNNGYNHLKDELEELYKNHSNDTFVMFYSGGADSTFLLLLCREIGIPVKCVLIQYYPSWSINYCEMEEAKENLKKIGQEYEIIQVDLNDALVHYGDQARKDLLFNRHLAVHFYETYRVVAEKYGKNIVVINGQSADSILSFGPSEFTFGNHIKRLILAVEGHAWMYIFKGLFKLFKVKYLPACTKSEAAKTILDETNYIFLLDTQCSYDELLNTELKAMKDKGISSFEAMRMYAKIISFLQGSDNQVVLKAANTLGIRKIVMPFTSPYFIYTTLKFKNNFREIRNPKYFVRDLTKGHFKYKRYSVDRESYDIEKDFDMEYFEDKFNITYKQYLYEITEGKNKNDGK